MVLFKIVFVGAFAALMLGVAKQQHWFERAGLVSSCALVATPAGQPAGGSWYLCREGIMTGYPRLERDNCDSRGFVGKLELWHCDTIADVRSRL
jgi:hypothetical protein